MSLGEGSEVRGRLPTRGSSLDGLHRAHAAGQEPHVVREVSRHDSDLALRAEEDDRLLEHLLAGTDHPEGSVPAGAVLPEDAILGAVEVLVSGPQRKPVGVVLGRLELLVSFEVDAVLLAALLRSARRVAPPTWNGDELVLANVPPVGQAALLRAKVWNADAAAVAGRA